MAGQQDKAKQRLTELQALAKKQYVPPTFLAQVHLGLNQPERALTQLRKAAR
jgi:predicted Zn-dependent protease